MARTVSIQGFKSKLLRPATTSNFYVEVGVPGDEALDYIKARLGGAFTLGEGGQQGTLNLLCTEAKLPGSSLATFEITSDFTGVTERHAHRRMFDANIDLTFYVNAEQYLPIKFFEAWIDYIAGANLEEQKSSSYHYRMHYADDYTSKQGLAVTKFERDSYAPSDSGELGYKPGDSYEPTGSELRYNFIRSFPTAITSMPVSYEGTSLLKCTVSMTYIRYVIGSVEATGYESPTPLTSALDFRSAFNAGSFFNLT
mgnify:CR=1 FL=1|tara:strand:+ start:218 stop:982 length:765 start_codon:yes stop_codon:yes gene_type:complete